MAQMKEESSSTMAELKLTCCRSGDSGLPKPGRMDLIRLEVLGEHDAGVIKRAGVEGTAAK
jgi:hypothetical protein